VSDVKNSIHRNKTPPSYRDNTINTNNNYMFNQKINTQTILISVYSIFSIVGGGDTMLFIYVASLA
jgi:hypothetical protein